MKAERNKSRKWGWGWKKKIRMTMKELKGNNQVGMREEQKGKTGGNDVHTQIYRLIIK